MKNGGKKKINYCSVFSEKKFCMVVLNLAKSISRLLLEKKNKLVTKREKKVRCASAVSKVIFVFPL